MSWSRISLPMNWMCRLRAAWAVCFGASAMARRSASLSGRRSVEQFGLEGGQAQAEILQGVQLALDLGFALLAGEVVVGIVRHRAGPRGNADMITSPGPVVSAENG